MAFNLAVIASKAIYTGFPLDCFARNDGISLLENHDSQRTKKNIHKDFRDTNELRHVLKSVRIRS
ncbi:MAG: hypothetical protein A3F17_05575 [Gammaproteobacteria bacterium RIFCSPHIGHO2_12_FULL_41_15]|nr:MAG: hypothetical protein A3F17_05575 [Gammaproteobacteria bacterium RIFCSPHIGHO2_12_FULL_41_15]